MTITISVYLPNYDCREEYTLPNNATEADIQKKIDEFRDDYGHVWEKGLFGKWVKTNRWKNAWQSPQKIRLGFGLKVSVLTYLRGGKSIKGYNSARRGWGSDEESRALNLFTAGKKYKEIATVLGRGMYSVRDKIRRLTNRKK